MFIDADKGITYVYVRDGKQEEAKEVTRNLEDVLGGDLPNRVKGLPAKYSFVELKRWHDRLLIQVLKEGIRAVTLLDVDDNKNRIRVGLEDSAAKGQVKKQLSKLDIPAEAVTFEVTGPGALSKTLVDKHRPLVGGLQIEPTGGGFCTLGFIAISEKAAEAEPVREPEEGFVTNSHCSLKQFALDDTKYYQPQLNGVNQIGVERLDPPLFTSADSPDCPDVSVLGRPVLRGLCRWSDSDFSEIEETPGAEVATVDLGFIARPDLGYKPPSVPAAAPPWNEQNTFRIDQEAPTLDMLDGAIVAKVGRTTGRTEGEITGLNVTPLWTAFLGGYLLLDQVEADYRLRRGDSGAPVILAGASDPQINEVGTTLVGINWGVLSLGDVVPLSNGMFSPISGVERDLGPLNTCAPAVSPC